MKKKKSFIELVVSLVVVILFVGGCFVFGENKPSYKHEQAISSVWNCDYKVVSLKTDIVCSNKEEEVEISGKIIRFVTDKLSMQADGKEIGRASDDYQLIKQDNHTIIINDKIQYIMAGQFCLFGGEYDILDANENKVGELSNNVFGTKFYLVINDQLVAKMERNYFRRDYKVEMHTSNEIEEKSALLMIASAYDDFLADSKVSTKTSSNE